MKWWAEGRPTIHICYHPHTERYLFHWWVEKCASCGEVRTVEEMGKLSDTYWPPVSKTHHHDGLRERS